MIGKHRYMWHTIYYGKLNKVLKIASLPLWFTFRPTNLIFPFQQLFLYLYILVSVLRSPWAIVLTMSLKVIDIHILIYHSMGDYSSFGAVPVPSHLVPSGLRMYPGLHWHRYPPEPPRQCPFSHKPWTIWHGSTGVVAVQRRLYSTAKRMIHDIWFGVHLIHCTSNNEVFW